MDVIRKIINAEYRKHLRVTNEWLISFYYTFLKPKNNMGRSIQEWDQVQFVESSL